MADSQQIRQLERQLAEHEGRSHGNAFEKIDLQGNFNQRLRNYPLGMTQLLRVLSILESLQIEDGLADVFDGIAGETGYERIAESSGHKVTERGQALPADTVAE